MEEKHIKFIKKRSYFKTLTALLALTTTLSGFALKSDKVTAAESNSNIDIIVDLDNKENLLSNQNNVIEMDHFMGKTTSKGTNLLVIPDLSKSSYKGLSIVDALHTSGYESDLSYRLSLARHFGIKNYSGESDENLLLLEYLRTWNKDNNKEVDTNIAENNKDKKTKKDKLQSIKHEHKYTWIELNDKEEQGICTCGKTKKRLHSLKKTYENGYEKSYCKTCDYEVTRKHFLHGEIPTDLVYKYKKVNSDGSLLLEATYMCKCGTEVTIHKNVVCDFDISVEALDDFKHLLVTECKEYGYREEQVLDCEFETVIEVSPISGKHLEVNACNKCGRRIEKEVDCVPDGKKRYETNNGVMHIYEICSICNDKCNQFNNYLGNTDYDNSSTHNHNPSNVNYIVKGSNNDGTHNLEATYYCNICGEDIVLTKTESCSYTTSYLQTERDSIHKKVDECSICQDRKEVEEVCTPSDELECVKEGDIIYEYYGCELCQGRCQQVPHTDHKMGPWEERNNKEHIRYCICTEEREVQNHNITYDKSTNNWILNCPDCGYTKTVADHEHGEDEMDYLDIVMDKKIYDNLVSKSQFANPNPSPYDVCSWYEVYCPDCDNVYRINYKHNFVNGKCTRTKYCQGILDPNYVPASNDEIETEEISSIEELQDDIHNEEITLPEADIIDNINNDTTIEEVPKDTIDENSTITDEIAKLDELKEKLTYVESLEKKFVIEKIEKKKVIALAYKK